MSAVNFGLFTFLGQDGKRTSEIKGHPGLQTSTRHVCDFLDALVSLGFLHRDGLMEAATYPNTPVTAAFLDRTKDTYIGGMLLAEALSLFASLGMPDFAQRTSARLAHSTYSGRRDPNLQSVAVASASRRYV